VQYPHAGSVFLLVLPSVAASWDGVEFWLEFSVPTGVGVSEESTVCENKKTVRKLSIFT